MKNTILTLASFTTLAGAANAQSWTATNLVQNSSMDTTSVIDQGYSPNSLFDADAYLAAGNTDVANWSVGGSGVGYNLGYTGVFNLGAAVGSNGSAQLANGYVQQEISSIDPNLFYSVRTVFHHSADSNDPRGILVQVLGGQTGNLYHSSIRLDGTIRSGYQVEGPDVVDDTYTTYNGSNFKSTASDSTYLIRISGSHDATGLDPDGGVWLTGVELYSNKVPEPSSSALLGFGALGLLIRRKR